jgi:hypothetical protein
MALRRFLVADGVVVIFMTHWFTYSLVISLCGLRMLDRRIEFAASADVPDVLDGKTG